MVNIDINTGYLWALRLRVTSTAFSQIQALPPDSMPLPSQVIVISHLA